MQYLHYLQYDTYTTNNTILIRLATQYFHYLQLNAYSIYNTVTADNF